MTEKKCEACEHHARGPGHGCGCPHTCKPQKKTISLCSAHRITEKGCAACEAVFAPEPVEGWEKQFERQFENIITVEYDPLMNVTHPAQESDPRPKIIAFIKKLLQKHREELVKVVEKQRWPGYKEDPIFWGENLKKMQYAFNKITVDKALDAIINYLKGQK